MTPDDFTRAFAFAFGDQDTDAMAELIAPEGTVHSLTGIWAEGREEARVAFEAEAAGLFARARLVTGKGSTLPLAGDVALLRQRFVVTGAIDETGAEMPRFGAMLVAVLQSDGLNWRAASLTITLIS
jgi:ketosteroid isomerase-like protein